MPLKSEIKVVTKVTKFHTMELNNADIRSLLLKSDIAIPAGAKIYVMVPGGGDWSNTSLDLDDTPLIIEWTEVVES